MVSTFSSLEVASRALSAQQAAIQTTGNNIANANTDGYSRERVNLETTTPYPSPGFMAPTSGGQIGTGVQAGSVQRIRSSYADLQVRNQSTQNGYWSTKSDALSKVESVMNEPSDQGLSTVIDNFWQSLQDLSDNPNNDGARSVVVQQGKSVADTFNYLNKSLTQINGDLKTQINTSVDQINSLADQINNLNKQIAQVEPNGYLPNELYDKRDSLVDQLSTLANVKVSTVSSGGNSPSNATGKYTVQLVDQSGNAYTLVDGSTLNTNKLNVSYDQNEAVTGMTIDGKTVPNQAIGGKLQGTIDSYSKDIPNMLHKLDDMAYSFATAFNNQNKAGTDQNGNPGSNFFSVQVANNQPPDGASATISVDSNMTTSGIAAAGQNQPSGDNSNALNLAKVVEGSPITFNDGTHTELKKYYQDIIGNMGVDAQQANRMSDNTATLKTSAENQRSSVSGVSIDEEMTNLIQYQHAYNASAKVMSTISTMLDTLINTIR